MKTKQPVFNLFFFGIFISGIIYSPFVLDFTLTPRLICLSTVLILCFCLLYKKQQKDGLSLDLVSASYVVYFSFSCFSWLWANTRSEAIFENAKFFTAISVFFLSYHFFKQDKEAALNRLCRISVGLVLLELIIVSYHLSFLKSFNKEELYNVTGFNAHKNLVSSFLYLQLVFLIPGAIRMQKHWKWLSILSLLITLAIIALIQTKAVWIGLLVSGLVYGMLVVYRRFKINLNVKWGLMVCVILANLFFLFAEPAIIKRGLSFNAAQNDPAIKNKKELDNERLELWDKTYDMIGKHPVIGVGAGNWQVYFPDATLNDMWRAEDLNYTFQRPHNDLLWILSETGYLGFNLFLVFVCSLLLFLLKVIRVSDKENLVEAYVCFTGIIGFFTVSFFDFPKERIEHLIWINVIFGFAYYLITKHMALKPIFRIKSGKTVLAAGIFLGLITLITGIYRYRGELHTRRLYDQKAKNNINAVIKEGKEAMSFAYTLDPVSVPIPWYTGNAHAIAGNYAKAKSDLLAALTLNPYNRNVLNDLGSAYVVTKQSDSAYYYYREACRISPRFDDAKLNLAVLYFNRQQFEKADSCLKTLLHDSERRSQYQKLVDAFLGRKQD